MTSQTQIGIKTFSSVLGLNIFLGITFQKCPIIQYVNEILSIGLSSGYINITTIIPDIMHSPVFYLKHNVSETGFL
jgi:hypothetical protein